MSSSCKFDCKYCANSSTSKCAKKKVSYEPEELAKVFDFLVRKLDVHGLFLSSAVSGEADKVTERMINAVKLIRGKYRFRGYVHFKVLPGTSFELIKQASELSQRMSINIEAPNKSVMSELSSCKDFKIDILRRQAWISKLGRDQSTQFIVSNYSSDKDILKMLKWEYEKLKLSRIYFAAFRPVKGTLMENENAVRESRQNHLYNVDFLIRRYDYNYKEIEGVFDDGGMLPNEDPKLAIAKANFDRAVDINEMSYWELVRVPGIGPVTAKKIENMKGRIGCYADLHKLGGHVRRAKPFVKVGGRVQKMLGEWC